MRVGVSDFIPARLTQARESASLTRLELSARLGKSSSSVSRWEKGESAPEAEALQAMSLMLGFPITWFTKPLGEHEKSPVFYRTLASTTRDLRTRAGLRMEWLQEIFIYLSTWLDWPALNLPDVQITDHRELRAADIAKAAAECRRLWGLGLGPISDLALAAESAGIVCARTFQGNTKMDGLSQWNESAQRAFILLSDDKCNYYRSRFDLAHEIGHIVLHRRIKTFDNLHLKEIERQANYFASCLLLPEESISIEISRYPSLESLLSMKRRWSVSVAAIIYRSEKLNLIDEEQALRLRKSYSARGWAKGEPLDNEQPVEIIRLLPRAMKTALEARVLTKEQILRDLVISRKEIEKICGLPNDFLSVESIPVSNAIPTLKGTTTGTVVKFKRR